MSLSSKEIQEFFDKGYVVKENLFSHEEVESMTESFDKLQKAARRFHKPTIYKNSQFVVNGERIDRIVWACGFEPNLKKYAQDDRLLTPSSQLLGTAKVNHIIC